MEPRNPSALDDFMFDLNGYLVLRNAVEPELVKEVNAAFDALPPLEYGEWLGNAQRRDYNKHTGLELHNCVELGGPFEKLLDHPGYINYLRRYCGEEQSYVEGLFVDECILSVRRSGGHHPVHSGGYKGALRGAYHYKDGVFRVGQCNIIIAWTDVGPGDGPTMLIPGSHKSNFPHPQQGDYMKGDRMDTLEGAIPLYMKAGDALLFCDGTMHGGSSRTSESGERRVTIYRYGPLWASTRFGYVYSDELLNRVTPAQRKLLRPIEFLRPGDSPNGNRGEKVKELA
jgi:ectoine hydroxylase-related dioxygenase (phytanoyl-CoA dioxygenase family)